MCVSKKQTIKTFDMLRIGRERLITAEANVADASIFTDNNRDIKEAFVVFRVQLGDHELFGLRQLSTRGPSAIQE